MPSQASLAQLPIGQIGFGAMRITGPGVWGPPRDEPEAIALLRRAIEKGVTFIDTADSYGPGISETLIAKALYPYPPGLVVATKGGLLRPGANRWVTDCRPEHLRHACAESLKRLQVERIELYQLHAVDPRIPIEESIGALVDLQREGKIRHIGVSNVAERELARARAVASIVSVQNHYNLRDRSSDRLIDICAEAGIAFIPWYPLAAGRLASLTPVLPASPSAMAPHRVRSRSLGYCSVPRRWCQSLERPRSLISRRILHPPRSGSPRTSFSPLLRYSERAFPGCSTATRRCSAALALPC